jgi:hypothetical protein
LASNNSVVEDEVNSGSSQCLDNLDRGSLEQAIFSESGILRDPTAEVDSNCEEERNKARWALGRKSRRIDWSSARNNCRAKEQPVLRTGKLLGVFEVRE